MDVRVHAYRETEGQREAEREAYRMKGKHNAITGQGRQRPGEPKGVVRRAKWASYKSTEGEQSDTFHRGEVTTQRQVYEPARGHHDSVSEIIR